MKTTLPLAFLFATIFSSCNIKTKENSTSQNDTVDTIFNHLGTSNTTTELLCQNWEDSTDLADGILHGSSDDGLDIPFHGFSFFKDGVVVKDPRDDMKTGKWSFDEKNRELQIVFNDASKLNYQVKDIGVEVLLLQPTKGPATKYIADGKQHKEPLADPFYPTNNKWRIKPGHAENDNSIKERMMACVHFYNRFLEDNTDRKLSFISFYGLPTCFKWYVGGISIINKDKLGQKWMDCFYNKDQAIKGQQLLENIITKKYDWKKKENSWVRQSADVLLQIADSLK